MVKCTGPMMSFDASGKLGNSVVFSKWKGRNYVRRLVKPANPKSALQVSVRAMMKFLSQNWANLSGAQQSDWNDLAEADVVSPFNAFTKFNLSNWRNFIAPSMVYPATRAAGVDDLSVFTATAGVRQVTLDLTAANVEATNWGTLIFKSLTSSFTTSVSNLVAAVPLASSQSTVWVDTPLDPDTYYYNARSFSLDGTIGDEQSEVNATVT